MKKLMKRIGAVLMAVAMMAALGVTGAFADESSTHVITIDNTDQNVSHSYEAYQIFVGKLDASGQKLSDIKWGSGVNSTVLLDALKTSTDTNLMETVGNETLNVFRDCSSAADVAEVFAKFQSTNGLTDNSGAIDAIAKIIAETTNALSTTKVAFTEGTGTNVGKYTATVTGDGYYFVKDTTTALTNADDKTSDTLSKYMLSVIKDTTINAKDTHLNPDKEILQSGGTTVKEGTAAVGDTVTFQVTIPVPDTRKYVDHFIFDMKDKLPVGMTFMGISSVKVGEDNVPYTLTVAPKDSTNYAAYTALANAAAAVTTAGGQQIKLVFNNFKAFAETANKDYIGENMVVTYTAVVNDDADFTSTGNKNEVVFDYSNDPNHDYNGDEPTGDDVVGTTPKDETTTYLTNILIQKKGEGDDAEKLAGAEFEIESTDYNVTLVTGEKFEATGYTAQAGETVQTGTYYKLKDGSYTTTAPTDSTKTSYDSTTATYVKVTFSKSNTTPTGTPKKVTVITDENGQIKLEGLKPGTYKIKETKAPTGYNLDTNTYTIKIDWDATNKVCVLDTDASEGATWTANTATASITIQNKSGSKLPSTGGIGTYVFTVAGVAIMAIAAGLLIVRHKKKAE